MFIDSLEVSYMLKPYKVIIKIKLIQQETQLSIKKSTVASSGSAPFGRLVVPPKHQRHPISKHIMSRTYGLNIIKNFTFHFKRTVVRSKF